MENKIQPMQATWHIGEEKTELYRALNIIHQMAGGLAVAEKDKWHLYGTATYQDYVRTDWSNGIVIVGAQTHKDEEGKPTSHHYYLKPEPKEDE